MVYNTGKISKKVTKKVVEASFNFIFLPVRIRVKIRWGKNNPTLYGHVRKRGRVECRPQNQKCFYFYHKRRRTF